MLVVGGQHGHEPGGQAGVEALLAHWVLIPPQGVSLLLVSEANPAALAMGCRGASREAPLAFEHDLNRAWPPLVPLPARKEGEVSSSLRDPASYSPEELAGWATVRHAALIWEEIRAWGPTHALDLHETPDRRARTPFAFAESEADLALAPTGVRVAVAPSQRTLQRALAEIGVPNLALEVRPGGRSVEERGAEHRDMVLEVLSRLA